MLMVLAWVLAPAMAGPDVAVSKEYKVKAAFLFNFTKFVEWAPARFTAATDPLVIGVLGGNPFGAELANIVADRKVHGREIALRLLASAAEARGVHAVFVCSGESPRQATLAALHDAGVLTVGESGSFAAAGGIVTFSVEGEKIRFTVNLASSQRAQLKISAQLLKLAAVVHH
jgi:hypothetical protein